MISYENQNKLPNINELDYNNQTFGNNDIVKMALNENMTHLVVFVIRHFKYQLIKYEIDHIRKSLRADAPIFNNKKIGNFITFSPRLKINADASQIFLEYSWDNNENKSINTGKINKFPEYEGVFIVESRHFEILDGKRGSLDDALESKDILMMNHRIEARTNDRYIISKSTKDGHGVTL